MIFNSLTILVFLSVTFWLGWGLCVGGIRVGRIRFWLSRIRPRALIVFQTEWMMIASFTMGAGSIGLVTAQ